MAVVLVIARSAVGPVELIAVEKLFPGFGSVVAELTVAVLMIGPVALGLTA